MYRQACWDEKLVYELSRPGVTGFTTPINPQEVREAGERSLGKVPKNLLRDSLNLPELSELTVVRHFTRLSQMNYSISTGFYPLGSCTMKYNPVVNNQLAELVADIHPLQPAETVQGCLEILYNLEQALKTLTGMDAFSMVPAAGAHGELVGCLIIRAYHSEKEGKPRPKIIVPDSAHGTNPASAAMAGFEVSVVRTREDGCVDLEMLEKMVDGDIAGIMLTNPNTIGLFEKDIEEIVRIMHQNDSLLYYDGANLNAIVGVARPGDMGFDIVHLNLHKTFSTPHGGGGPGAGPVGVVAKLAKYLPPPRVVKNSEGRFVLEDGGSSSIGPVKLFTGNFAVLLRAYAYILAMGGEGLRRAALYAVTSSNYLLSKVRQLRGVTLPFDPSRPRKHEFVVSLAKLRKETGLGALEVAKRLLDYGVHAPTIYFPLIVEEAFMVEPTETESKETLDNFYEVLSKVVQECYESPELVKSAPHNTAVGRINEAKASHPIHLTLSMRMKKRKQNEQNTSA
ncbi:MAG: aminomethyl-transferring glycine dehydrogenase subunit GcvPB [Candidatus Caldarchaeum sp.]|uniref:Probable glycine dehydrogenase (decarboxylating) subunit 2 n=3 Tax=Caldiarchaeum subterraneum TaxID=311458 RepID=A0A7J3G5U1_CALS0|nr:aminomethyl-transferring glycine dehydrogenase subunit GcvPB [Candidatus Caldarchaeales archaeon]